MGQKKVKGKTRPRVVLDTNVFISAVLFRGLSNQLLWLWQNGKMTVLLSAEVLKEYLRVLSYPKFKLAPEEIKSVVKNTLLPFVETVKVRCRINAIKQDPDDNKFLELAVEGKADFILSGDKHLLELKKFRGVEAVSAGRFLKKYC